MENHTPPLDPVHRPEQAIMTMDLEERVDQHLIKSELGTEEDQGSVGNAGRVNLDTAIPPIPDLASDGERRF